MKGLILLATILLGTSNSYAGCLDVFASNDPRAKLLSNLRTEVFINLENAPRVMGLDAKRSIEALNSLVGVGFLHIRDRTDRVGVRYIYLSESIKNCLSRDY